MRGATSNAGPEPAATAPPKVWKPRLPFWRRPAEDPAPVKSSRTPITPAPDAPDHYAMGFGNRLLLSLPILLLSLSGLAAFATLVWPRPEAILLRVAGFLWAVLCGVLVWFSRRRLGRIVMSAEIDTAEIRFRQWNRKVLALPKRGRVLKKVSTNVENPLIELRPAEVEDAIFFFRHDKAAISFLAGLERRGVVRGPGGAKMPNPLVPR